MAKIEYMTNAFQSDLKPRARLVLNCLALHSNKEGQCFPSIKTIAKECGYSVNTVKRALDDLVEAGFVVKEARFDTERKHGGQTSNLYTLNIEQPKGEEEKKQGKTSEQKKTADCEVQAEIDHKQTSQKLSEKQYIKNELGVAHNDECADTIEISKESMYPYYNFSWAGEEPKSASP